MNVAAVVYFSVPQSGMHRNLGQIFILIFLLWGCSAQQLSIGSQEREVAANSLVSAYSPYLQSHAFDLIDWQEYSQAVIGLAQDRNLPLLMVVGKFGDATCYEWQQNCLLDSTIAYWANDYFISILIDPGERPDLDNYFQHLGKETAGLARQYPLTVLALPTGEVVQVAAYQNPTSWVQMVHNFGALYQNNPEAWDDLVLPQPEQFPGTGLAAYRSPIPNFADSLIHAMEKTGPDNGTAIYHRLGATTMDFLLFHAAYSSDLESRDWAVNRLREQAYGAIYDQLGGGFFHQATDRGWRKPAFEKLLYDQALMIRAYARAYQLTGEELFAQVAYETMDMVDRNLEGTLQGYFGGLSAVSEGEHGRYYLWPLIEVEALLLDESEMFCRYYNLTASGNWGNGQSVPYRSFSDEEAAAAYGLSVPEWQAQIMKLQEKMFEARSHRLLPKQDLKEVIGWNALMVSAWVAAYRAFGDEDFLQKALTTADFLRLNSRMENGELHRYLVGGQGVGVGFLDDYSYLAQAYLELYQVTLDGRWLNAARELIGYAIPRFFDASLGAFSYKPVGGTFSPNVPTGVLADPNLPDPEAIFVECMLQLHHLIGLPTYQQIALAILNRESDRLFADPRSSVDWARMTLIRKEGMKLLLHSDPSDFQVQQIVGQYRPGYLLIGGNLAEEKLIERGHDPQEAEFWVCPADYGDCLPFRDLEEVSAYLNGE